MFENFKFGPFEHYWSNERTLNRKNKTQFWLVKEWFLSSRSVFMYQPLSCPRPSSDRKTFTKFHPKQVWLDVKDDTSYFLDNLGKTWRVLDCRGIGEHTYHSVSLICQSTLVAGGVKYEDFNPVKRYNISTINLIKLDFKTECSGQVQILKETVAPSQH